MDTNKLETEVDVLLRKAAKVEKSEDAMRFSQAALNAAHTLQVLSLTELNKIELKLKQLGMWK